MFFWYYLQFFILTLKSSYGKQNLLIFTFLPEICTFVHKYFYILWFGPPPPPPGNSQKFKWRFAGGPMVAR